MPVWTARCRNQDPGCVSIRGCHKERSAFFFFTKALSDVWWLPTNRHRLPTNCHRLHTNRYQLPTNRHRLPTNRHRLHTNRHRLHTNRHRLHTNRHRLPTNRHRLPAIGYPPTAIGYTPTAIGYTPTAISYPPAAIIGRIGHSEFFFFIMATPGFYGGHSTGYKLGNHPKNIEPCAHRATTPPVTSIGLVTAMPNNGCSIRDISRRLFALLLDFCY